jgi:hypothetical protein
VTENFDNVLGTIKKSGITREAPGATSPIGMGALEMGVTDPDPATVWYDKELMLAAVAAPGPELVNVSSR